MIIKAIILLAIVILIFLDLASLLKEILVSRLEVRVFPGMAWGRVAFIWTKISAREGFGFRA